MKTKPRQRTDHDLLSKQGEAILPEPKKLNTPQFDNKLFYLYLDIIKQK